MGQILENKNRIQRIGILGGTFDPIHYGHLISAQWARETFELDKVLFIPAGSPPHKLNNKILPGKHRHIMTVLATVDQPSFEVSSMEMKRKGPSYTIDTINELLLSYGEDTELFFITGADSILELHTWERYEELLNKCYFIATTREGYDPKKLYKRIEEMKVIFGDTIHYMDIPAVGISSTALRSRIREGRSIKYLLPPSVEQYIMKNKLYSHLGV